eukprot:gene6666-1192_t
MGPPVPLGGPTFAILNEAQRGSQELAKRQEDNLRVVHLRETKVADLVLCVSGYDQVDRGEPLEPFHFSVNTLLLSPLLAALPNELVFATWTRIMAYGSPALDYCLYLVLYANDKFNYLIACICNGFCLVSNRYTEMFADLVASLIAKRQDEFRFPQACLTLLPTAILKDEKQKRLEDEEARSAATVACVECNLSSAAVPLHLAPVYTHGILCASSPRVEAFVMKKDWPAYKQTHGMT